MAKKIGGRQRKERKSKLDRLVERNTPTLIELVIGKESSRHLISRIGINNGYILKDYHNLNIPIKDIKFDGQYSSFRVVVSEGSYVERQLRDKGVL